MPTRDPVSTELATCGVCNSDSLKLVWDLPRFPVTEAFGKFDSHFPSPDQAVMKCSSCAHVQLKWQLDPHYLYSPETYAFGSWSSPKLDEEHKFLIRFIEGLVPNLSVASTLEFGANNLSFAMKILELTDQLVVCDPLLPEKSEDARIRCLPKTIEDVIASGLSFRPELVIARHTLEHIGDPVSVVNALLDAAAAPGLLVFEVPSLDHLKTKLRFDAITHQHIHYFDLASIRELAKRTSSHLVDVTYNERGSNGGSLIFALSRHPSKASRSSSQQSHAAAPVQLEESIATFKRQMRFLREVVDWSSEDTVGFGASLMLATLDYHLEGSISELRLIFDDNQTRHETSYCNLDVSVLSTDHLLTPERMTFFVTSFENTRAIYSRLRDIGAGRIVAPVVS